MRNQLLPCFGRSTFRRVSARMLALVALFVFVSHGGGYAQTPKPTLQTKVSINFTNASVLNVLNTLQKKSGLNFIFKEEDVRDLPPLTKNYTDTPIEEILTTCLANTKLQYDMVNETVIIKRKTNIERLTIFGTITDKNKIPIPGVAVVLKGTSIGVAADGMGRFKIEFGKIPQMVLRFSLVGMETREVTVTSSTQLNVIMKETETNIDDVVVTGYFSRDKSTFTGAVTTLKGEDLIQVSQTNLIKAIATLTPGMRIAENNAAGSNPNVMPDIIIRGTSSLLSKDEVGLNTPLIVLDGVEISIEELYDLDMYDIESVNILKDASATVMYGERASNGVIVIERYRVKDSKVRLSYNFVPNFSIPDLSSLNLTNASQKLELERLSGLYDSADGSMDRAYAYKLNNIRRGVDTDWTRIPLRVPLSHTHSLQLSGRGQNLDYRTSLRFGDAYGVMKGDNRRNYSLDLYLGYHTPNKITISYRASVKMTDSRNSPYGDFAQYTKLNPYEPIYDEYGDLIKIYPFDPFNSNSSKMNNPLYEATLSSFSKARSMTITNSLDARWDITKLFFVTGQMSVGLSSRTSDKYISPDSPSLGLEDGTFAGRGKYTLSGGDGLNYEGKLMINYRKIFDQEGTAFLINAGGNIGHSRTNTFSTIATGFMKDNLNDLAYATEYPINGRPSGAETLSANVGFLASGNFVYKNRYFADFSYRTSGSSKFGRNQAWAPFWALGVGWNIHKEKFIHADWLNSLRLKWSFGYTGSVAFSPYQAITTYEYKKDNEYYTGIGANPKTMGNPNLKWQKTLNNNIGITSSLFNDRLNIDFDYYTKTTTDMLMPISMPWHVGIASVKVNYGEIKNSGLDFSMSGSIVKNPNFMWRMTVSGGHNFDRISKISDALKKTNEEAGTKELPTLLYEEGGSQFAIYAMRSAGIDPATGREIFIRKDGSRTFQYDSYERVAVGNTNPILEGSWTNSFAYKGFSLSISTSYTFGGDIYNQTLWDKVENIDPRQNVDARAFTDRWKKPGDIARFLGLSPSKGDVFNSERFVERKNEIYISNVTFAYEFSAKSLEKIGLKRLSVGFGMSDVGRISTVKFERGTSYPYCRSFNLTFRPTF